MTTSTLMKSRMLGPMEASNPCVKVVKLCLRTVNYSEGQAPGNVVETQDFDHCVLGPVVCRVRSSEGRNIRSLELSEEALKKLGFKFSFYRSRGVHKLMLEQIEDAD